MLNQRDVAWETYTKAAQFGEACDTRNSPTIRRDSAGRDPSAEKEVGRIRGD